MNLFQIQKPKSLFGLLFVTSLLFSPESFAMEKGFFEELINSPKMLEEYSNPNKTEDLKDKLKNKNPKDLEKLLTDLDKQRKNIEIVSKHIASLITTEAVTASPQSTLGAKKVSPQPETEQTGKSIEELAGDLAWIQASMKEIIAAKEKSSKLGKGTYETYVNPFGPLVVSLKDRSKEDLEVLKEELSEKVSTGSMSFKRESQSVMRIKEFISFLQRTAPSQKNETRDK